MAKKVIFPDGVGGIVVRNGDYGNGTDEEYDLYMYVECIDLSLRTVIHKRSGKWFWRQWWEGESGNVELPEM